MKKLNYKDVKDYIESIEGYKLLNEEYKNNNSKLKLRCPQNHKFEMSFRAFQQGQRCSICHGTPRHKYTYIKNYIEFYGFKLISKKYYNNNTKLIIECPKGHISEKPFHSFLYGSRCAECVGNKKHSYNEIKNYIELQNYTLLSKSYNGAFKKLEIRCPENHIYKVNWSNFQKGRRCPICRNKQLSSKVEKEIVDYIKTMYGGIIIENDRTQIVNPKTGNYLELDVWLPELNKAIEYNGEYWHSTEDVKYKDEQKLIQCKKKGIDLLVIEDEKWRKNKDYNLINNFIGET